MKLTPHPILLSLSGRLLQVTVAISPPAAKGASKGPVFCAHPVGRSPQANAGFRNRVRGELQRRNKKFYQSKGTADFRERVRRSIWRSEPRLSGHRILPAGGILSFGGEFFPIVCFSCLMEWNRCQPYPRAEYVFYNLASLFSYVLPTGRLPRKSRFTGCAFS